MANILFVEPFFSGSHQYFAEAIQQKSRHNIELLTLPGRFWKWRMESASLELASQCKDKTKPELVITSNLMDLAQWKSFCPWPEVPLLLYVHENQLDYPLSPGEKRDLHYVWKDYLNYLLADRIIFNSEYNRTSFINGFKRFRKKLPDCKPEDPEFMIRNKSVIIPPGCRAVDSVDLSAKNLAQGKKPLFLWNHRWEHDKNPEDFFQFLRTLKEDGFAFELALLGEQYSQSPIVFQQAETEFKTELVHFGFCESRQDYEQWLIKSDFVFSSSKQENFGIAMVEAMSAGCLPLLPYRLAYPEVVPKELHRHFLYEDLSDLKTKLFDLISNEKRKVLRDQVIKSVQSYFWGPVIRKMDDFLQNCVAQDTDSANL